MAYTYDFDAWGALISINDNQGHTISGNSLATTNPLRYRGYVYDDETGLYYLQSRYYDPKTGRFLNADVYFDTETGSPLSTNMFAYCENCPLYKIDTNGKDAWWLQAKISVWSMGHTSILVQEKAGYWWYIYWSGESVQVLFLGTLGRDQINEYVSKVLIVFSKLFNINVKKTDNYNSIIKLSGGFSASYKFALSYAQGLPYRYVRTKYYTLSYNPNDGYNEEELCAMTKGQIERLLRNKTHRQYKNKCRPQSYVVLNNPEYDTYKFNCMHFSILSLSKGYTNKDNKKFQYALKEIQRWDFIPNSGFRRFLNIYRYVTEIGI